MVGGALFVIFNRPIAKLMCDMSPFLDDGWIAHSRRGCVLIGTIYAVVGSVLFVRHYSDPYWPRALAILLLFIGIVTATVGTARWWQRRQERRHAVVGLAHKTVPPPKTRRKQRTSPRASA
jgi:hypothetical protein